VLLRERRDREVLLEVISLGVDRTDAVSLAFVEDRSAEV
jgi:hypothetical protein